MKIKIKIKPAALVAGFLFFRVNRIHEKNGNLFFFF